MAGITSGAKLFLDEDGEYIEVPDVDLTPSITVTEASEEWKDDIKKLIEGGEITMDVIFSPCPHHFYVFTGMKNKGFAFECKDCETVITIYVEDNKQ